MIFIVPNIVVFWAHDNNEGQNESKVAVDVLEAPMQSSDDCKLDLEAVLIREGLVVSERDCFRLRMKHSVADNVEVRNDECVLYSDCRKMLTQLCS